MTPFGSAITDILPAAAAMVGVPGATDRLGLTQRLGEVDRVGIVLVDGMGFHLLPVLAPYAPLLASVLARSVGQLDELSCTFPSTTPTSLVSFATGARPGEHGILGFTLSVPGTDRLLTHITWRDDPPPDQWQPVPTWFERAARAGTPTRAVLPNYFGGSGLTMAAYRGARFCGLGQGEDYASRFAGELADGPGLVFGYTAALDTAAHRYGIASPQWAQTAAAVDGMLAHILAALPPTAALLITADHGGIDVPAEGRVDIAAEPDLAAGLRIVAGEPRVRYLHTVAGAAGDVAHAWQEILGDRADVRSRDEAIEAGWFGPVRPAHRERIGDVVVTCTGTTVVLATDREPAEVAALIGFHGANTAEETAIPLIGLRR